MTQAQRIFLSGLFCCTLLVAFSANAVSKYETPPTLKASKALPAEIRKGTSYEVLEPVSNDGMMNLYAISSTFGEFIAPGGIMLRVRLQEIQALEELDRISKTTVFVKAAAQAGLKQVKEVATLIKESHAFYREAKEQGAEETAKSIFANTKARYQKKAKEKIKAAKKRIGKIKESLPSKKNAGSEEHAADATQEPATPEIPTEKELLELSKQKAKEYFGVTEAERKWAQKLRVDPYSSNMALRNAIQQVALVDRLGSLSIKVVPVPEIPGSEYLGTAQKVGSFLWEKTPQELENLNRTQLQALGTNEDAIEAFSNHPRYSPTLQTMLASALTELDGVAGREGVIDEALSMTSEEQAWLLVETVTCLAQFHKNTASIQHLQTDLPLPVAVTRDDRLVFILPSDALFWTEEVAEFAESYAEATSEVKASQRELWTTGVVSEMCKRELKTLGWTVKEHVAPSSTARIQ